MGILIMSTSGNESNNCQILPGTTDVEANLVLTFAILAPVAVRPAMVVPYSRSTVSSISYGSTVSSRHSLLREMVIVYQSAKWLWVVATSCGKIR